MLKILRMYDDVILPRKMTTGSSGFDLYAYTEHEKVIEVGEIDIVPTGIKIALPEGYEAQIRSRSGLVTKFGIAVANSPGTIDSDYRGEIKVALINLSHKEFIISKNMRIAQMVIAKVEQVEFEEVKELDDTERSDGGFGSTG